MEEKITKKSSAARVTFYAYQAFLCLMVPKPFNAYQAFLCLSAPEMLQFMHIKVKKLKLIYLGTTSFCGMVCPAGVFAPAKMMETPF
jgi:hypothetical protein